MQIDKRRLQYEGYWVSVNFLPTIPRRCFYCGSYLLFLFGFAIRPCLFLADLWSPVGKRAELLALLYVMFSCVFVIFPYGVLGQVWFFIALIPDLCLLSYFY